jgi:hypothetical protein
MRPHFDPIAEFERISRNRPHPDIPKGLPKATDGTTAASIEEQSKRVLQQLPTGKVELEDDPELAKLADFIWNEQILKNAITQADPLTKHIASIKNALGLGSQPAIVQFTRRGEYVGADWRLPYIKDVFYEPGQLNDVDSNFIFVRSWYTKSKIDEIIENEKRNKAEFPGYKTTYDLKALADLRESLKSKEHEAKTPTEKDRNDTSPYAEVITALQRGIGGEFITWSVDLKKAVRTKQNRDPRGEMPLITLYGDTDMQSPVGRSIIELTGGLQNVLDSQLQLFQYNLGMLNAPPVKVRGNIPTANIKLRPDKVIRLGSSQANDIDILNIPTVGVTSFSQNYSLTKSQILNLNNSFDTSVSGSAGNPQFSKTDAGVNAQEQRVNTADNFILNKFEAYYQRLSETMLNVHFAESTGTREVQLTEAYIKKNFPGASPEEVANKAVIDYDAVTKALHYTVDPGTSKLKDTAEERERTLELLDITMKYPMLQTVINVPELADRIVKSSNIENPEELLINQQQLAGQQQQQLQQYGDPGDQQMVQLMQEKGYDQMAIEQAMTMLSQGMPAQEVFKVIGEPKGVVPGVQQQ